MRFSDIEKMFPAEDWDVGYLTLDQLKICSYRPIKSKMQNFGRDFTNNIYFNWKAILGGIVLVRRSEESHDYSIFEESRKLLNENGVLEYEEYEQWQATENNGGQWSQFYTNFKEAQILSGLGVRAKNSLVYNRKFGFDCKICVIAVMDKIEKPPANKPGFEYWEKCDGCSDCRLNCPVGAIHNEKEPYWLDSSKCDNFIGLSDHPRIPSMKKFWHKYVHPEAAQEVVNRITDILVTGPLPWNANGYEIINGICYKDGQQVPIPFCRECLSQPRCSKWGGNYPYER